MNTSFGLPSASCSRAGTMTSSIAWSPRAALSSGRVNERAIRATPSRFCSFGALSITTTSASCRVQTPLISATPVRLSISTMSAKSDSRNWRRIHSK